MIKAIEFLDDDSMLRDKIVLLGILYKNLLDKLIRTENLTVL